MRKMLSSISLLILIISTVTSIHTLIAEDLPQNSQVPKPNYPPHPGEIEPPSTAVNILVYSSDYDILPPNRYPVQALDNLGLEYTYVEDNAFALIDFLTKEEWCIVVIDEPSSINSAWDALNDYVVAGGCLIYSTWYMFGIPTHPLWASMGVSYVGYFSTPLDVYQWDTSHPIFNDPNPLPNPMTGFSDEWTIDGEIVGLVGDGIAIGGATSLPSADILLVVANEGRTVFNGFLFAEMDGDADADGKPDAVELIENEIMFVMPWCTPPPVGGEYVPVNTLTLLAPYLVIIAVAGAGAAGILRRKRTI